MAETMIVCRESSNAPSGRGLFVSLRRRPDSEMEATEIARAIRATVEDSAVRTLEDGPFGGSPVSIGDERLGEMVDAPLSRDAPWSAVGISDFSVVQTAYQMAQGTDVAASDAGTGRSACIYVDCPTCVPSWDILI